MDAGITPIRGVFAQHFCNTSTVFAALKKLPAQHHVGFFPPVCPEWFSPLMAVRF